MSAPEQAERDELHLGPSHPDRGSPLARWALTDPFARGLLITAALLAVLAVVLANAAANTQPRRHTERIVDSSVPIARSVDAAGCPVGAHCTVLLSAPTALPAAVRRVFGPARIGIFRGSQTVDTATHRLYVATLSATVRYGVVDVYAACIPDAPAVAARSQRLASSHTDLSGDTVIDSQRFVDVVPGDRGCSVVVDLESTRSTATAMAQLTHQLAADPAVQVHQ